MSNNTHGISQEALDAAWPASNELPPASACSSLSHCVDPLSISDMPQHIVGVLRRLCSQEGCDGGEWDVMAQAADYIEQLEKNAAGEASALKLCVQFICKEASRLDEWGDEENPSGIQITIEGHRNELASTLRQCAAMVIEACPSAKPDSEARNERSKSAAPTCS